MDTLPERSLTDEIFQILDSRIQYIDYQLNKLSRQSLRFDQNTVYQGADNLFSIEIIFKQIELHNKSLKLLLLLRKRLNALNAPIIFQLLTDSKYLDFEEFELIEELGGENAPIGLMQQQQANSNS
ncbi:MAG: hypothetical protein AB8F74_08020 [Saprospiraceae bacterium]